MIASVKATAMRYNMFDGVTDVTVALSGGADSVALLSVMLQLREEFGFTVRAAHLNHCLRGEESDRDEQYVRRLCAERKVELFCERADVSGYAQKNGLSVELAARRVRYEFLERVSKGVIATAHTASDNIETVLYNAVRGTGIAGLCGIPPKRDRFVRPLIGVTRAEIEKYCELQGLSYCVDSTNSDLDITRNRIRHSVVPQLVSVNQAAVRNVFALSETLREDAQFLNDMANSAFDSAFSDGGLKAEELRKLPPAILKRCVARLFEKTVGSTLERQHINAVCVLLQEGGGKLGVQCDYTAVLKGGILRFVPSKPQKIEPLTVETLPIAYEGYNIRIVTKKEFENLAKFNSLLLNNALDYDKICGRLQLRGRLPKDRITLAKRRCTKTFKKLLNESGLDEYRRDRLLVAADSEGVLWLGTFGADARAAVTEATVSVVVFEALT